MAYKFFKSSGLEMHTEIFMGERIWSLRLSLKYSRKNKEVKTDKKFGKILTTGVLQFIILSAYCLWEVLL